MFRGRLWAVWVCALALAGVAGHAEPATSLNQSGIEAFDKGEVDLAIRYFSEALSQEPDNGVIRRNLASAHQHMAGVLLKDGYSEDALEEIRLALDADPMNAEPLVFMGSVFLKLGWNSDAIFRLEDAIELDADNVNAHFLLGEAYYRDNDSEAALEQWDWVQSVEPGLSGLQERLESVRREARVEEDFRDRHSRHFNVSYNRDVGYADVRNILRILEDAYLVVGRTLGRTYPSEPIQVTLYAADEFAEATRLGSHIGAVYDGTKIRCPVLNEDGGLIREDVLKRLLWHEYVHVVVRELAHDRVPWWLNEGLAETLSHKLTRDGRAFLRNAREEPGLFSLEELTGDQLTRLDPARLELAYRQAHATVSYLDENYGMRTLASLLRRIADGQEPEPALRLTCRIDYEFLERGVDNLINNE